MAHDRLAHISLFRTGTGLAVMLNETLGPIGEKSKWLVEHLEMALGVYNSTPEESHEIFHSISNMPWETPDGLKLNTLRIRLARVKDVASELEAAWFTDFPVTGDEFFVVSATLIRRD